MSIARVLVSVSVAGCVASNSVVCEDGRTCPQSTVCDEVHALCITPDQLTACVNLHDRDACQLATEAGSCHDGVCLPASCGNGRVDTGELCDDGNKADGDGCAADCSSDETCGNHVIDLARGEECDDGNHLDHDGCSSHCFVETPHWIEHASAPTARVRGMIAYDSTRDRVVMFGGQAYPISRNLDDTWEWTHGEWVHAQVTAGPVSRIDGAMAFDAAHDRAVLFGGLGAGFLGDTWLWDGSTWSAADVTGPPPRYGATMVADPRRGRLVLFGGLGSPNGPPAQNAFHDTWAWNGTTWTELHPSHVPPARLWTAATYDPKRDVIVMTGGLDDAFSNTFADTWEFDGTDWHDVTPSSGAVPAVDRAAMAYDPASHAAVLFGGREAVTHNALATLWAWNGTTWTLTGITGPSARFQMMLASSGTPLVLFGGNVGGTSTSETWLFANGAWTLPASPGPRSSFAMTNDPIRGRAIVYGGYTDWVNHIRSGETWEFAQGGLKLISSSGPAARAFPCSAYDQAHDAIVMFGGSTGAGAGTASAETWIWDAGWTPRSPSQAPLARTLAACAFDGHEVTLFGGEAITQLGDAWRWDGASWSPIATPAALTARSGAMAAYDPVRKRMVMFGGISATFGVFNETWLFDGTTWTPAAEGFRPPGGNRGAMVWNAARQTLVLLDTAGNAADPIGAYEWDGTRWSTIAAADAPLQRGDVEAMSSLDGAGIEIYGGLDARSAPIAVYAERWELRWDAPHAHDRCTDRDLDGDALVRCNDPDCWWVCAPLCPPGTTCDPSAPTCGDGICDASRESCRTCPADCTCSAICGDFICDPGEVCPGDCP